MNRSKYTGKKEMLSEKERVDIWDLVSSYNRLGFVLHNYPRIFLYPSLKTKFLKWDAERVIEWRRIRLSVYKERIDKPETSEVEHEFEWLFNEAIKYQERKYRKKIKGNF